MKNLICLLTIALFNLESYAQDKAVPYKELQKHLPDQLLGFSIKGEPDGNTFEMKGLSYSMAAKDYRKGNISMTISIMDYIGADNMYQASTMAWTDEMSYEDDNHIAKGINIDGIPGWLILDKKEEKTNLFLGYKDRYLIGINIYNLYDESLARQVAEKLNIKQLP